MVDPQRDAARFLELIDRLGVEVRVVCDTHVHNDYLSGTPGLARRLGADPVLPAGSGVEYRFRPAFHLEDLEIGEGLTLRPLHTPGHTPEHVAYLASIDGLPRAVFSGGSLLVGSAGRTDLLGSSLTEVLATLQFGSVSRLAGLPDQVGLYPTHGSGSFCTSAPAGPDTSTIGRERESNPLLRVDEERFVEAITAGLAPYPDYYAHMAPLNRSGPELVDRLEPPVVSTRDELVRLLDRGATVVDVRNRFAYAEGHLPGSLNIEAGTEAAAWVGWLVPFGSPVVLVTGGADVSSLILDLARIGYETGGLVTDPGALPRTTRSGVASVAELVERLGSVAVLDVRDPLERARRALPGTVHRYLPDLRRGLPDEFADADEIWTVCESGFRASIAAGLVERAGRRPVVVAQGGVSSVAS